MTASYSLLAGVALKSVIVLGAAGLLAIVLRASSAAVRHMLWTAAFAGLVALPVLTVALPGLPAPVSPAVVFRTASAPLQSRLGMNASAPRASASGVQRDTPMPTSSSWRAWIALLWLSGSAASLAQMAIAWLAMARVRRRARPVPGVHLDGVPILETPAGSMPMTFGLLRPAIFLPSDASAWSSEGRSVVLLHELAHVRRGDAATHLAARAALSLYWWNPLAWIAWRQFVRERERAADDLVLSAGARPSEYASHLLEIARTFHAGPALGWAAVAMARRSQLEGRLLAILDSSVNRRAPQRPAGWVAAVATVLLIAPLAALRAQDTQTVPADVDATIRAAAAQKNHIMLERTAKAAEVYRQYDLARKLLDSSLAIRSEEYGQQSVDYGIGLVKLGDLERGRRNIDEAKAFYTKAVSVLGNRPEAAPALIDLGLLAMRPNQDTQEAYDYFQKAQVADPSKAGPALMWMAVVRDQQKDTAMADQLFQQAIASVRPSSTDAANTMQVYASFLQRQGHDEEAKTILAQAWAIRAWLASSQTYRLAASETPLRVGNGVTAPALIEKVEPEYSEEARVAKYQGTVVVGVAIGTDGTAQAMHIIRGLGLGLDEKALEAISQWKFKPGAKDGQPVPVMATIEVNFRLL